jgi:radial spoke head protein 1
MQLPNSQGTFRGEHVEYRKEGYGVYEFANGMRYEGHFCRGKRHGHGTYFYPSGAKFVGEWAAGKRLGGKYIGGDGPGLGPPNGARYSVSRWLIVSHGR